MDQTDKKILDIIQSGFPIAPRPYAEIGNQVGLSEDETLARVRALKDQGVIRRMGASFQSKGLGYTSTLCAAKVPEDKIDEFTACVNEYPGVTHNYLRENKFNIWFTFIAPSMEFIENTLAEIAEKTGIRVLNLPAEKMFKIKVDFDMGTK